MQIDFELVFPVDLNSQNRCPGYNANILNHLFYQIGCISQWKSRANICYCQVRDFGLVWKAWSFEESESVFKPLKMWLWYISHINILWNLFIIGPTIRVYAIKVPHGFFELNFYRCSDNIQKPLGKYVSMM